LLTVAAVPLVAIRIYAASGFDQNTALALAAFAPVSVLAIATFVTITQSLFAALAFYLLAAASSMLRDKSRRLRGVLSLVSGATVGLFVLRSSETALSFAVYCVVLGAAVVAGIIYSKWLKSRLKVDVRTWILIVLALQLAYIATSQQIWLPPETVKVRGETLTAYVLTEPEGEIVLFLRESSTVVRLSEKDVTERQFCSLPRTNPVMRAEPDGVRPVCP
jgi:hypothetical protein